MKELELNNYVFYPKDFRLDPAVLQLDPITRGFYRDVIDESYLTGNRFTIDENLFSRVFGYDKSDEKNVKNTDENTQNTSIHTMCVKLVELGLLKMCKKSRDKNAPQYYMVPSTEKRLKKVLEGRKAAQKRWDKKDLPKGLPNGSPSGLPNGSPKGSPSAQVQRTSKRTSTKAKAKGVIPTLQEFIIEAKEYCEIKELSYDSIALKVENKYQTWVEDKWKDGHGKEIKNWRTKLRNAIGYFDPKPIKEKKKGVQNWS